MMGSLNETRHLRKSAGWISRLAPPNRLLAGLLTLGGCGLLVLALPRLADNLSLLAITGLTRDHARPTGQAIAGTERPLADLATALGSPQAWRQAAKTAIAGGNYPVAAAALRQALRLAPGHADDWATLAALSDVGAVSPTEAVAAFERAVALQGFEPSFTPWLFGLGIRLWPVLPPSGHAAFEQLTWRQWQWGPGRLTEITRDARAELVIAPILAQDPAALADFERRLQLLGPLDQAR